MQTTPFQKIQGIGQIVGPAEVLISLFFEIQHDNHMRDYRWDLFRQGITVDRYGRKRSSRTGELVE